MKLLMRIAQEVREDARTKGLDAEQGLTAAMEEKAKEFREAGGKVYKKVWLTGFSLIPVEE